MFFNYAFHVQLGSRKLYEIIYKNSCYREFEDESPQWIEWESNPLASKNLGELKCVLFNNRARTNI